MHALTVPVHKVPVFGHFTLFFAHFLRILEAAQIEMHGLFGRRLDPAEREHTAVERGVGRNAWHVVVLVPVGAGDDPRQAHGVEAGNGGDAFASRAEGILKRCKEQRGVLVAVGGGIEQQAGEVAAHPALRERVPGDAADEAAYAVRVREHEAVLFREIGMAQQQCVKPLGALRRVAHGLRPGGVP